MPRFLSGWSRPRAGKQALNMATYEVTMPALSSTMTEGALRRGRSVVLGGPGEMAEATAALRALFSRRRAPDAEHSANPTDFSISFRNATLGKIVEWSKSVGDAVEVGETIMVVESDKADMDVEAFESGFLASIYVDDGETAVGTTVAVIAETEEEAVILDGAAAPAAPAAAVLPRPLRPPPPRPWPPPRRAAARSCRP